MDPKLVEWTRLGAELALISPAKFSEIVDALRETVAARELLVGATWSLSAIASEFPELHKA